MRTRKIIKKLNEPRPYDLLNDTELLRLTFEMRGYAKASAYWRKDAAQKYYQMLRVLADQRIPMTPDTATKLLPLVNQQAFAYEGGDIEGRQYAIEAIKALSAKAVTA